MLAPGIHAVTPTQWLGKLHRVGVPHLEALSRELAETSTLAALFENRVEVIAVVESPHVIRMSNVVGHILPLTPVLWAKRLPRFSPGSTGKAIAELWDLSIHQTHHHRSQGLEPGV